MGDRNPNGVAWNLENINAFLALYESHSRITLPQRRNGNGGFPTPDESNFPDRGWWRALNILSVRPELFLPRKNHRRYRSGWSDNAQYRSSEVLHCSRMMGLNWYSVGCHVIDNRRMKFVGHYLPIAGGSSKLIWKNASRNSWALRNFSLASFLEIAV